MQTFHNILTVCASRFQHVLSIIGNNLCLVISSMLAQNLSVLFKGIEYHCLSTKDSKHILSERIN